ncbi:MAG: DUF4198 domain-containing protein [Planctomycetota bacterium]
MKTALQRLAFALALAPLASAQSVTHFHPDVWRTSEGASVSIAPRIDLEEAEWKTRPFEWMFVRGAGSQSNHDELPTPAGARASDEQPQRFTFEASTSDTWMVGVDLAPRVERVAPERWSAFRRTHAVDAPAAPTERRAGAADVRVDRRESTKTLVVVRDARGRSGSSGTSMSKTGQRMEIRPLSDPCTTIPGSALPIRLYVPDGLPLDRVLVARQLTSGETLRTRFDAKGFGHVVLPSAGPWRLEVHAARPEPKRKDVDWTVFSTTLTFEAPPMPPTEKEEQR